MGGCEGVGGGGRKSIATCEVTDLKRLIEEGDIIGEVHLIK